MSISRVYRLLRLITMLQSGRKYTTKQLAEELEVSRRTVFRDLNMLELARVPYYYDAEAGGYNINQHFFLPPVNLTLTEALAVLTMTARLRNAGDLPLLAHGSSAAMKLRSALPRPMRQELGPMADGLTVSLGKISSHEGLDSLFVELTGAIARRRLCRMAYSSLYERRRIRTDVRPLRLFFMGRGWYLLGHSSMHRQIRTFKLVRIEDLVVTDKTFAAPKDVDLDEYFGDAWSMIPEGTCHDVHLHFAPQVAANVAEVLWHPSQRVEWNGDGSIEFYVRVDGLGEIGWWVLGYADQVRVISPAGLQRRVKKAALAMAHQYGDGGPQA